MDTQETRIYAAVVLTCIVFGVIVVYFFVSIIRQQRKMLQLQRQNLLAEIDAMERERSRIARDLHDDVGPLLSVIKFQIDNAGEYHPSEKLQLDKASQGIDHLIDRMREIANNLMPAVLERKGLIDAIEEYISRLDPSISLPIHFSYAPDIILERDQSINLYRIVQEVIHNCIKHARANSLTIKLDKQDGMLVMLFKDDGIGFDYDKKALDGKGFGLNSLLSRARIMGGKMEVQSSAGKGSLLIFEIPIK
jgi:signal transduction histidine kinase